MLPLNSLVEYVTGLAIGIAVIAWLALSVLRYVTALEHHIASRDVFYLIPQWSFFAPVPNRFDYHLFVRLRHDKDGHSTMWREVIIARQRYWYAFIWNPDRRLRKGFFDLCIALFSLKDQDAVVVLVSLPYLHLLTISIAEASNYSANSYDMVQFAVGIASSGSPDDGLQVLFASDYHPVSDLVQSTDAISS